MCDRIKVNAVNEYSINTWCCSNHFLKIHMTLAICTIQRDRGPWIREWIEFHKIVGFDKFYIFLHNCTDNSSEVVSELSKKYDITTFIVSNDVIRPQLAAYQYCYQHFGDLHDWIAFIDGDEFLFSPNEISVKPILNHFEQYNLSALGVYWLCFGSSNHITEPVGLITDNYRYRAPFNFGNNSHIKSIVKGGQKSNFSVLNNSHYFQTSNGTFDTNLRPIIHGYTNNVPCHDKLIINHYVTQSREYFDKFKKLSGGADTSPLAVRTEDWWLAHDINEVFDNSLSHLKSLILSQCI